MSWALTKPSHWNIFRIGIVLFFYKLLVLPKNKINFFLDLKKCIVSRRPDIKEKMNVEDELFLCMLILNNFVLWCFVWDNAAQQEPVRDQECLITLSWTCKDKLKQTKRCINYIIRMRDLNLPWLWQLNVSEVF